MKFSPRYKAALIEAHRRGLKLKLPARGDDYEGWLGANFSDVAKAPLGERHHRFWTWIAELRRGARPRPRVEIWPRGGAKSSTIELGCAFIGAAARPERRFALYVCNTQEQADLHVQAVGSLLERLGVPRAVSKHGNIRGWRRNQLRAATGFSIAALGLDVSVRGLKLDSFRPDLIIFDDVDNQEDSAETVAKKERIIKNAILPAGSVEDCAIVFVQNLVHENGVICRLVDGKSDFLVTREVSAVEKAVVGLEVDRFPDPDIGRNVWKIIGGEATWAGQSLKTCEEQINDWGLRAFLTEAQHEVYGMAGIFFDQTQFVEVDEIPAGLKLRIVRCWDLAATENGGDWTVGVLMGLAENGLIYILDVKRHQFESKKVRELMRLTAERDARGEVWSSDFWEAGRLMSRGTLHFTFLNHVKPGTTVLQRVAREGGSSGKEQGERITEELLAGFLAISVLDTGSKATRALSYADRVNQGNVRLLPGEWREAFREEHKLFREDESHKHDDQVDAAASAFNELTDPTTVSSPVSAPAGNEEIPSYKPAGMTSPVAIASSSIPDYRPF